MGFFDDLHQRAFGGSQNQQFQAFDPFQQRQFERLIGRGFGQADRTSQGFQQLPQLGQQFGQASAGLGLNAAQGAGQGLEPFTGSGFLGPQIAGSFGAIQHLLGQNLGGAGGIDATSNLFGGFGGGRQAVERGAAIGTAGAQFGQQVGDIFASDLLRRQQAAGLQGQQQLLGTGLGLSGLQQGFGLQQQGLLGSFGGLGQVGGLLSGAAPRALTFGNTNDKAGFFGSNALGQIASAYGGGMGG